MNEITPGIYRHYKGARYLVLFVAETCEHNGDMDVVYVPMDHAKVVTRPLRRDSRKRDSWFDLVAWPNGERAHRFQKEVLLHPDYLAKLDQLAAAYKEQR